MNKLTLTLATALIALSSFAAHGADSQPTYDALNAEEMTVIVKDPASGEPIVGAQVKEKSIMGLLCRKSAAVVPEPVWSYECFVEMNYTAAKMQSFYNAIRGPAQLMEHQNADGSPLVGAVTLEKRGNGYICQKQEAVVPNPVPSYTCFRSFSSVK